MRLCEYGCGNEALFQMTSGKWCCSEFYSKCPSIRSKNKEGLRKRFENLSVEERSKKFGSWHGKKHTEEQKKKISQGNKGKLKGKKLNLTDEQRYERGNSWRGRKHTEETKRKISQSNKGRKTPIEIIEKIKKTKSERVYIISDETRLKLQSMNKGKKYKPFSEETRKRMSESAKKKSPTTEETRRNMSKAQRGKKHTEETKLKMKLSAIERNKSEEYIKKLIEASNKKWSSPEYLAKRKGVYNNTESPNKQEKILMEILPDYFRFVGDFSFWIDGKNPDFINEEKKLVVEFFGDYWHGEEFRKTKNDPSTNEEHERQRIEHFEKNGYRCLVIWEHELKDVEKLKEKIYSFKFSSLM